MHHARYREIGSFDFAAIHGKPNTIFYVIMDVIHQQTNFARQYNLTFAKIMPSLKSVYYLEAPHQLLKLVLFLNLLGHTHQLF